MSVFVPDAGLMLTDNSELEWILHYILMELSPFLFCFDVKSILLSFLFNFSNPLM